MDLSFCEDNIEIVRMHGFEEIGFSKVDHDRGRGRGGRSMIIVTHIFYHN